MRETRLTQAEIEEKIQHFLNLPVNRGSIANLEIKKKNGTSWFHRTSKTTILFGKVRVGTDIVDEDEVREASRDAISMRAYRSFR